MRFAYIDSQGKEVGIPSVEALQLRIELGAITEETIFYDAGKDRWDPAGEHEIFRSLSREIRERGHGGPRPPTPKVSGRPPEEEDSASSVRRRAADPFGQDQDPLVETAKPGEVDWVEAELEDLTQPEQEGTPANGGGSGSGSEGDWDMDLGEFGSLDLAPGLEDVAEPSAAKETPEPDLPVLDGISDADALASDEAEEDLGDDLELETPFSERHAADASVAGDSSLDLEAPLAEQAGETSAQDDDEPGPSGRVGGLAGAWEREESEAEDDAPVPHPFDGEAAEAGPPVRDAAADETGDRPISRRDPYERRTQPPETASRPRRSRPLPRRKSGRAAGLVAAGVGAVAVAAGGWFGWSVLRDGGESTVELTETVVALPEIPEELTPLAREVGDSAYTDMLAGLREMASAFDLAEEPNEDWLAGIYLANADRYPDVIAYWGAFRNYADSVRAADEDTFMDAVRTRLAGSGVPAESRDTVLARIRAGFQAAAPERRAVYDDLEDLIYAATGLHEFLLGNESNIEYEPAAGLSRDPVTEAIPSSQALGEEMWDRVGRIPAALDELGTLDRVTTERILDVFFRRLGTIGIR